VRPSSDGDWGAELKRRAQLAVARARRRREGVFNPECLTLYMNNECNLSCVYCHSDPLPGPASRLDAETIVAAAEVVAENCKQKDRPFYLVFHGGGEPTLHRERVEQAMALVLAVAAKHEVETFRYVATNGVLPEAKAVWLARQCDLVGLSCDGPAEIHDRQRARWDGRGTLHLVERTGRILREEGCPLHVRTTITQASLRRQAEVASYICQQFSPGEIHFEPVYLGGRTRTATGLGSQHADEFVAHFLQARAVAQSYGIPLLSSGSRPGALHGPYCHPFRDVLNLVPGDGSAPGVATACFKLTRAAEIRARGGMIGELNREAGCFEIDEHRVQALCQQLDAALPDCIGCFNRHHCARECPDQCPLEPGAGSPATWQPGFRCRVQKAIALAILNETADCLWSEVLAGQKKSPHGTTIL
jgi:pyruvate-formate lyase-activating enzyme